MEVQVFSAAPKLKQVSGSEAGGNQVFEFAQKTIPLKDVTLAAAAVAGLAR